MPPARSARGNGKKIMFSGVARVRVKRPTNPTVPGGEEFVLGSPDFKSSSTLVKLPTGSPPTS